MRGHSLPTTIRNARGSVMIFTILAIVFLLVIGGLAVDMAHMVTVDNELERAMDAAALAGAGKLGFDDTVFPTARQFAHDFAVNNAFRIGTIDLSVNTNNAYTGPLASMPAPYGDVVLGIWDPTKPVGVGTGQRFEPSNDGSRVNAVWCRYKTTLPTSLFRLWGINTMPVSAEAFATANPPQNPPPTSCTFPIGLSSCPFETGGVFTSQGCGKPIKFITSNGKDDSTNTAAWVSLDDGQNPTPPYLQAKIKAAIDGTCQAPTVSGGETAQTQNGMDASVFKMLEDAFVAKFAASKASGVLLTVNGPSGTPSDGYQGYGWDIYVPVIQTDCTAGGTTASITGDHTIVGWTRFVITQVYDTTGANSGCMVENPNDYITAPWCTNPPPELQGGASRSLFGYYDCTKIDSPPIPTPVPRAALGTKLRIVQ